MRSVLLFKMAGVDINDYAGKSRITQLEKNLKSVPTTSPIFDPKNSSREP